MKISCNDDIVICLQRLTASVLYNPLPCIQYDTNESKYQRVKYHVAELLALYNINDLNHTEKITWERHLGFLKTMHNIPDAVRCANNSVVEQQFTMPDTPISPCSIIDVRNSTRLPPKRSISITTKVDSSNDNDDASNDNDDNASNDVDNASNDVDNASNDDDASNNNDAAAAATRCLKSRRKNQLKNATCYSCTRFNKTSFAIKEYREIEKRRNNILIYGLGSMHLKDYHDCLADGQSDYKSVNHVLSLAGLSRHVVRSQTRINSKKGLDLVIITLRKNWHKKKIIESRQLIQYQLAYSVNIQINEDLSVNERHYRSHLIRLRNILNSELEFTDHLNRKYGLVNNNKFYFTIVDGEIKKRVVY